MSSTSSKVIVLITGANRGLGLETGRQLLELDAKYHVIFASRDPAKAEAALAALRKAAGSRVSTVALDVANAATITTAAAEVEKVHGRLDVLINNAGITGLGTPSAVTADLIRSVFEVNVVGLVAVTQAFLPLLKKSEAGRIVNVSSILGSHAEHADPNSFIHGALYAAYDMSKAAVNLYTQELALELKDTPIKVNSAHPGWVKTDMGGEHAQLEIKDGVSTMIDLATLPAAGATGGFFHRGVHMRW